jgi:hypothetical protein
MAYDPYTGADYNLQEAQRAWSRTMGLSAPRWDVRGGPGAWHWHFWNFGPWAGRVTDLDSGAERFGTTKSVFVAYRSVERNELVAHP